MLAVFLAENRIILNVKTFKGETWSFKTALFYTVALQRLLLITLYEMIPGNIL